MGLSSGRIAHITADNQGPNSSETLAMLVATKTIRGRDADIDLYASALRNTECYRALDRMQTTTTPPFEIPTSLNHKTLFWLSLDSEVTSNWRLLGIYMGLSDGTLDCIAYRNRTDLKEVVYSTLFRGAGGDLTVLIEALRNCRCPGAYQRLSL